MSGQIRIRMTFERTDEQGTVLASDSFGAQLEDGPDLMWLAERYAANTVTQYLPIFLEGASK